MQANPYLSAARPASAYSMNKFRSRAFGKLCEAQVGSNASLSKGL